MQQQTNSPKAVKEFQMSKNELILSFNSAVKTLDDTITCHQDSLPKQKTALRNLINQASKIISNYNENQSELESENNHQRRRIGELISVISGANSLLRGEPIDSNVINIMNKEMANASFYDKKINRVLAGISIVVIGMTAIALAALITPIWHVCPWFPFTKFGLAMYGMALMTPIFMIAGGDMALNSPPRTVAEELSEVVELFDAPEGLVPVKNEASWSFGLSNVFFKKKQPENQMTENRLETPACY